MTLVKSNKNEDLFPSLWSEFFENNKMLNNRWLDREFYQSLPAVNIKENNREYDVEFAAPGFKKSDFKINVEDDTLTISAEKQEEKDEKKGRFTRKEFSYNAFTRSFTLPKAINADKIDAKYNDGILMLTIPKKEETKALPKKEIKVA